MKHRARIIGVVVLLIGGASFCWIWKIEPIRRHLEFCRTTRADLETLVHKRPPELTRKQWENVVAWTFNAHANCITSERDIPRADMDRFSKQLKQRLAGPVTLDTIDWIWDEIVRITRHGKQYSDNWRPTHANPIEEGNWGIHVD